MNDSKFAMLVSSASCVESLASSLETSDSAGVGNRNNRSIRSRRGAVCVSIATTRRSGLFVEVGRLPRAAF